jgi:hypothetical protein
MNPDIADCHFRSIGAAVGGRIATLAQSDGRMEACHNKDSLEYTQNFVITSRKDLVPSCYTTTVSKN